MTTFGLFDCISPFQINHVGFKLTKNQLEAKLYSVMFNRRRNGILIVHVRDVQIRLSAPQISG